MQQPRGPTIPYSKFRLSSTFWPPRVHLWRLQHCRQQAGIPHIPLGCVWTCWSQISPVPISQEFSSPLLSPGMTCTFWGGAYTKFKGHPTATIHGNSPALGQPPSDGLPSKNRSQGLCHLVGLWQQIHIIEVCRMLFRSIAASSWQPPPRHFIAERLRLPRGSFSLRWERCGCFCCASCGKGWGFCKGSAQKCCCFLASSGLLPCTRECGIETGRCPRAGARWFLQVKPLM